MMKRNEKFQQRVPTASIKNSDIIVGFDTSSWLLQIRAKHADKRFVLDQTTAHPLEGQAAAERAFRDFPTWKDTLAPVLPALLQKQEQEHRCADLVVAASSFTRETLLRHGVPPDKIRLNPYGVDLDHFRPAEIRVHRRPIRFVFVGTMSARKGVPILLSAWDQLRLKEAELWLVGMTSKRVQRLIPDLPGLRVLGRKSREELPEVLRACDVFVHASYVEGFGLALLEALACGLPVIGTESGASPDLITSPQIGRLIQTGNPAELAGALKYFVENRHKIAAMSQAARLRAEEFSWSNYTDRWHTILEELS
jgi:alpha-maltose-1-phosphate synthase